MPLVAEGTVIILGSAQVEHAVVGSAYADVFVPPDGKYGMSFNKARPRCAPLARRRGLVVKPRLVAKEVNQRKADRLPHEAGLKLLAVPRARKELPVTAHLRNAHGVAEWKLFLKESNKLKP